MKRLIQAFVCGLLIANQSLADITYHGTTGQTLYVRVQTGASTFEGVAMTEGSSGGLGVYKTTDADLVSAGVSTASAAAGYPNGYPFTIRSGTASDTANDTILGSGQLSWSGSVEIAAPANTTYWSGTANASPDTAGYPKVTIKDGTGTGELDTASGVALANVTQLLGSGLSQTNSADLATGLSLFFANEANDNNSTASADLLTNIDTVTDTEIGAIKTKTDSLTFTVAGEVNANARYLSGTSLTARDIGASVLLSNGTGTGQISLGSGKVTVGTMTAACIDNTIFSPGAIDSSALAADAIGASQIAADAIGASELAADCLASSELAATAVDEIWDELQSGHTTPGTFGKYLDDEITDVSGGSSASAVADAVWDELTSGHATAGTFGLAIGDPSTLDELYAGSDLETDIAGISVSASPQLLQSTTIATLATQISFTLTAGSADNDAYNGGTAIFVDQSTATQKAVAVIDDYVGSTRTVTLAAAPAFTVATGDTVHIISPGGLAAATVTDVGAAASGASLTDIDQDPISSARTWTLVQTEDEGLVGESVKSLRRGPATPFAVDFRNDMAVNQRIITVDSVSIASGTGGGITFGTAGRDRTLAKFAITAVTAGTYTIEVVVTTNDGAEFEGVVTLVVP